MRRKTLSIAGCCLLIGLLYISAGASRAATNQTTAFINVGEGDSALIQDSGGFNVLIDGGKPAAGPTVVAYLRAHSVTHLDVMVASHADSDHIGGLIDVLHAPDITTTQIIYNGYPGDTATWTDFADAAQACGLTLTPVQFPAELTWGSMRAYVLNPSAGLVNPETNAASEVLRVDVNNGAMRYLFTGDMDATIEATVIARQTPLASQVLKVAHHGSAGSSSLAFLAAVQPQAAVISVGANNYGHPAAQTVSRLLSAGAQVYQTDRSGSIQVVSSGDRLTLVTELGGSGNLFLPLVLNSIPTPLPTPAPTANPTAPATVTTGKVVITAIFYDGVVSSAEPDEYVEIQNQDPNPIQLQNWTLFDHDSHTFTFPSFIIQPNQSCRVYTNQSHPETCGFDYHSSTAIWNNTGDCANLKDPTSALIDSKCYTP
ncbi:MAG TPA: lamin tail domain-containing protein [Anaerolineaceae bacterium]|jgi:competence protein ComEC